MDRGAWQAQSRGGQKELDMTEHIRVLFCQEGSPLHLVSFQNKQPTCWPEVLLGPDASGSRSSWNCTWETTEQADKSKPEPHCWVASVRSDHFQEKGGLANSEWERERNRERLRALRERAKALWWFSRSAVSDSCDPMDHSPPGSSVHGISQEDYWSGLPFPSPGDLPDPGVKLVSPALQAGSLPLISWGESSVETWALPAGWFCPGSEEAIILPLKSMTAPLVLF